MPATRRRRRGRADAAMRVARGFAAAALAALLIAPHGRTVDARRVEVLRATGGVPAHIAGQFREPLNFQQSEAGAYYVFDRRGHSVYIIDPGLRESRHAVMIGHEEGRLLEPTAFDLEPGGNFVVADAPSGRERIQIFGPAGLRLGGFSMPFRNAPRLSVGSLVLNGVGTLQFTGTSILINQPETGGLITEYGLAGTPTRTIGNLRPTAHEADRDVHFALNAGLPLVDPQGGFFFVFFAGEPLFRKYDAQGRLILERHIEGLELDPFIREMPTTWPRRRVDERELPIVPPVVRTAAVNAKGELWVSLAAGVTYVYDADGDKIRTVQFRAAGAISPTSLFFAGADRLLVTPGCHEFRVR